MTAATTTAAQAVDRRLDLFQASMNERLMLKDRWISDRFAELKALVDAERTTREQIAQILSETHRELHLNEKANAEEFKVSTQHRLDAILKTLDLLREERGLFVLREAHDTQMDALEKLIDGNENTLLERLEAATKQLRDTFDTRIQTNTDRIVKIEQNIQVMNARNQQSIIALGILLTLIEIIIRFYQ